MKFIQKTKSIQISFHSHLDNLPIRNKFYVPKSDGCGSLGLKINSEYLPAVEMEKCCDAHDICYDTCNSDKELCDLDFKRCLYKYCDSFEKSSAVNDLFSKGNILLLVINMR